MPVRMPLKHLILARETGKVDKDRNPVFERVEVSPGTPFDFTHEELADIKQNHPSHVRGLINENEEEAGDTGPQPLGDGDESETGQGALPRDPPKTGGKKGGSKAAVTTPADDDL